MARNYLSGIGRFRLPTDFFTASQLLKADVGKLPRAPGDSVSAQPGCSQSHEISTSAPASSHCWLQYSLSSATVHRQAGCAHFFGSILDMTIYPFVHGVANFPWHETVHSTDSCREAPVGTPRASDSPANYRHGGLRDDDYRAITHDVRGCFCAAG